MDENPNPSIPRASSSSSQEFLKQVQAALKRHRPLGTTQSHNVRPKRAMVALRKATNKLEEDPPSISDTCTGEGCKNEPSLLLESLSVGAHNKVQFLTEINNATAQPQDEASIGFNQHEKHQNMQQAESETSLVSEGGKTSMLPKRTIVTQDHLQQFKNFLRQPATQSSVVGLPCPTTTSVHSTSAPMLNSITHSNSCIDSGSHVAAEPYGNLNVNSRPIIQGYVKSPNISLKDTNRMSIDQVASAVQDCNSPIDAELTFKQSDPSKEQQGCMLKDTSISKYTSCHDDLLSKGQESAAVTNIQPQVLTSSSDLKLESSKLEKQEKNTSSKASSGIRKRAYDPELFFKVSGKLYQRLGKIGSGGSSEVHKVISSDCTIYALKKIKLKGRDYATAYGFCQEIEYLNRLKGKNNIIQLIDYEVGTLSYMSPEAFMCNESDASGNIIKCGRPSDIWSLGCILYQMVYGRTPFADYRTFWAKFKVITDPNHEITYEPVSNPWLLDLMKRCLAWHRNERWRIPQLLQHPFLVPPVPCHSSSSQDQTFKLLRLISKTCINDPEASQLCCQLQQLLGNPIKLTSMYSLNSLDQQCKLLSRISELCIQLQERLTKTDKQ
uniref:Protein kinase domain-containing protein n=2 Tax=Glycine max TaxID=3847 RepID=A0A0R0GK72_SOYBN